MLYLAVDALKYGVGAVLYHIFEGNDERAIAYTSHILSNSKLNYSQLEKEAVAVFF